jgi:hypothetical protein
VTVEVSPAEPRLSDEPTLTITIDAEEGVEVTPPPFGESIGGFVVRDYSRPLPKVHGGRRILGQVYRLEPVAAGEQVILPIPVRFRDAEGKDHVVETEALPVQVASMVAEEVPSLADLRPAEGPLPLPEAGGSWIAPGILLALLLSGGAAAWAWRRRRRPVHDAPRLSPRELAHRELMALVQADYLGREDYAGYYVELTAVVRRYIERTTDIRAPEQTTEEFLRAMQGHADFPGEKQVELKDFLESADLVKFAARRPAKEQVEASFELAKEFVGLAPRAEAVS